MWLPKAYAVLNTELAALFAALMTKVGAYALIRFFTLLFDQHTGVTSIVSIYVMYHNADRRFRCYCIS